MRSVEELNKYVAEWVGFAFETIDPQDGGDTVEVCIYPDGRRVLGEPDFAQSLDACRKWLVPELKNLALNHPLALASIAFFYVDGKVICKLSFFYVPPKGSYGLGALESPQWIVMSDESDDEPIALCRAIEKLLGADNV